MHPAHTESNLLCMSTQPIKAIEDSVADDGKHELPYQELSGVELASGDELLILSSTDPAKTPTVRH